MNGHQLKTIIDKDKYMSRMFVGIIKAKNFVAIPRTKHPPKAYIVNTENHWVLVVYYHHKTVYFDSYGEKPTVPMFRKLGCIQQSLIKLQPLDSSLCGLYVIFVLHYLARGVAFNRVLHMFYKKRKCNDKLVANFALSKYGFDAEFEIKV